MKIVYPVALALAVAIVSPAPLAQRPGGAAGGIRPGDGQMPPRAQTQREAPRGTAVLRGFVVAADTGTPLRRAMVRVSGQGASRLASTDGQGRFEVRELAAGRYTISASKGGFVPLQFGQRRPGEPGTPIEIGDGQVVEKLVIGLPPGSVISGRITDEFGEPLANAMVTAMRYGYAGGVRRLMPAGGQNARDTTDDHGAFRLFGLSPGEYIVSAAFRTPGEVTDPADEQTGYAPSYYPGTSNVAEAQRVNVGLGQEESGVIFSLVAARLVRVSGSVFTAQGAPMAAGMVMLTPMSTSSGAAMLQAASARIDGAGQFRLTNVAPGRYLAQARSMPGGGPGGRGRPGGVEEYGRVPLFVGGEDVENLVIVTSPGARVTGQVTTDTGTPPSFNPQQASVTSMPAEPQAGAAFGGGNARLAQDWSFELSGLFDARLFRISLPADWTLKAVLLGGDDITDRALELPPGQTIPGMRIVVTDRVSSVSGRVTNARGEPVVDATVVVFPSSEARWTYASRFVRTARPDLEGRFEIRGLPPSDDYLAVVVQGLESGQAGDPEFLASVRPLGTRFTLGDGEARALDLRF